MFEDDFREAQLKINDDKRIHINLSQLLPKESSKLTTGSTSSLSHKGPHGSGRMILLTVKISGDAFKRTAAAAGEFDRAWYRLVNGDTS